MKNTKLQTTYIKLQWKNMRGKCMEELVRESVIELSDKKRYIIMDRYRVKNYDYVLLVKEEIDEEMDEDEDEDEEESTEVLSEDEFAVTDEEGNEEVIEFPEAMTYDLDSLLNLYMSKTYLGTHPLRHGACL